MPRKAIRVMGGTQIVPIVNPVAWQRKGFAYRAYPSTGRNPTGPQLAAQIQLAKVAYSAYGSEGKVGGLPIVAAKVRAECSGKSHGGMSASDRASAAHEVAAGSIRAMESRLSKM